jgi:hypothetical protein
MFDPALITKAQTETSELVSVVSTQLTHCRDERSLLAQGCVLEVSGCKYLTSAFATLWPSNLISWTKQSPLSTYRMGSPRRFDITRSMAP